MQSLRFWPSWLGLALCLWSVYPVQAQPMVDPGDTIKRILAVHPAVRKAELEMAAADALVSGSRAQPNPVLALAVSAGDASENANYLAQNFEISGQPRLRYEQALARLEAARAQLRAARRQVAGEVCRAWLELYESGQLVRLAELRSELMAEMSRVGRRRYEVGEIPRNESLRVELAEAEATAEREKARAANQAASSGRKRPW